jgi:hypothetical protein
MNRDVVITWGGAGDLWVVVPHPSYTPLFLQVVVFQLFNDDIYVYSPSRHFIHEYP